MGSLKTTHEDTSGPRCRHCSSLFFSFFRAVLSHVRFFATPWTVCSLPDSSVHGNFSGKNTRVGCHFLLQGIFPPRDQNHISCVSCLVVILYQVYRIFKEESIPVIQVLLLHLEEFITNSSQK